MNYLVIDLVILAVLLIFALVGLKRGLIRSLLSLVTVLIALVGAALISNYLAQPVADWLQPTITPVVESVVQEVLPENLPDEVFSTDKITELLENADLPFGLNDMLSEAIGEHTLTISITQLTENLSAKLSLLIAYIALFVIAFIALLIILHLLTRTLDLVARLPGLKTLNKLGGFLFGLLWGAVILFVLGWLFRMGNSIIPSEAIEQTTLLRFFMTVNPLDLMANL